MSQQPMDTFKIVPMAQETSFASWSSLFTAYLAFNDTVLSPAQYGNTSKRLTSSDGDLSGFILLLESPEERTERCIGFVHYLFHGNTWRPTLDCYIDDLFVDESYRVMGQGRALIQAVKEAAKAKGCGRFYWATAPENERARKLYDSIDGAVCDRVVYQVRL
jgi:ribosomal protein S18 acetylase RimI-like enzyme